MKMLALVLLPVYFVLATGPLSACTIFCASKGNEVLVGNNEDWIDPGANVWFLPAAKGKYGRMYFGFGVGLPQGGMNERGLFFDCAATPPVEVAGAGRKEVFAGSLMEKALEECATVEEVLKLFDRFDLRFMRTYQIMFADRTGDAAIIEGDAVIRKEGDHLVVTNFRRSKGEENPYSIERYNIADRMLQAGDVRVEHFRSVLAATHQEGDCPTQYSNIYDLNRGIVYLYHFHNYADVVEIQVGEELKKGEHSFEIRSLFSQTSYAADQFFEKNKRKEHTAVKMDSQKFEALTGEYEILPALTLTVTKEQDRLFCRISGLPRLEIFPETDQAFFFRALDAQLTFGKDAAGKTDSLTLDMFGNVTPARKIK